MNKFWRRVLLVVIFVASSWALFAPGFFRVHDYTHAARIAEMTRALGDGHFPVRWTENFGFGFGMPLFEFYGPLPFYVGSLFYWLGVDIVFVLKLLLALTSLGTIYGAYLLGKKLFGATAGVMVAAALALSPYRALNLYVRGALSETWAIMAMPWILLGIVGVINREKRGWMVLVGGLVVLLLSHNITTLLFVPLSLLFAVGYGALLIYRQDNCYFQAHKLQKERITKTLLQLVASYSLAASVSAFYIIPAFVEKGFTKVEQTILGGYFNFNLHFLYIRQLFNPKWGYGGSGWGVDDGISFFLGWGQLIILFIAVIWGLNWIKLIIQKKKIARNIKEKAVAVIGLGLLLFIPLYMTLLKSDWLWQRIPLLSFVQFPWRWLSVAIVFLSLIGGWTLSIIRKRLFRRTYFWLMMVLLVSLNFIYFRPEKFLKDPSQFYYTDPQQIRANMSSILPDYIPTQMVDDIEPVHDLILGQIDNDRFQVLVNRTHEKLISLNLNQETAVDLAIANYPGWLAEIDGQRTDLVSGEMGNIKVIVPAGDHLLGVKFGSTPVRAWSDIVSAVGIIVFIALILNENQPRVIKRGRST